MRVLALLVVLGAGCRTGTTSSTDHVDSDRDGFFADDGDCNDADAAIFPGAAELCNGRDDDCNGTVDDGYATDAATFWRDGDGDTFGDVASPTTACAAPDGYVDEHTDCDDGAADVHPGATETDCTDPVDYNCDGSVGFDDVDGDGAAACRDCNDAVGTINPSAPESCDGVDNDCDTLIDKDDPSCGVCFVGQGGCAPGCTTGPEAPARGLPWLVLVAPILGISRRRRR